MIKLDLEEYKDIKNSYNQNFPNGYVLFCLSKTPTSDVFNKCRVELGCDEINEYKRKYRMFDAKSFATSEAFGRGKKWALDILNKYEEIFMNK